MSSNRAVVVDPAAPGRLVIHEVDYPSAAPSEALVRVKAISVNVPPHSMRRLLRSFPRWPRPDRELLVPQIQNELCRVGVPVQFGAA